MTAFRAKKNSTGFHEARKTQCAKRVQIYFPPSPVIYARPIFPPMQIALLKMFTVPSKTIICVPVGAIRAFPKRAIINRDFFCVTILLLLTGAREMRIGDLRAYCYECFPMHFLEKCINK